MLREDVFVHSWDLARTAGADDRLDPDLCTLCCRCLLSDSQMHVRSGMFDA
jgi:hypothetical protein